MYKSNTNWSIKMNIGDDVQFPLFINNGNRMAPVRYEFEENDGCEVYFYIVPIHGSFKDFILKKTFRTSTEDNIVTEFKNQEPEVKTVNSNINDNKDIVITLDSKDTLGLSPDEYRYVVRAKILTDKINSKNIVLNNKYTEVQVTNIYNFYLIDDDINRVY